MSELVSLAGDQVHKTVKFQAAINSAWMKSSSGGRIPVQVTANRTLGYEGPIEIKVKGLPKWITTSAATIPAGQDSTIVIFEAAGDAPFTQNAAPFQIVGRAKVGGRELVRVADEYMPLRVASVMPPPDLFVATEPKEVILEPGKTSTVTLHIDRRTALKAESPAM